MSVKRFMINLISRSVSFLVGISIQFLLTPYIVKTLGRDTYGFVSLANNFASYTMLASVGINSVAGVFIASAFHNNDIKKANKYYNSVLTADLFLAAIILILTQFMLLFIEKIIHIPNYLLSDFKLLFCLVLINCAVNIAISVYGTATFTKNRLDLNSISTTISELVRVILLFGLMFLTEPKISYYGVSVLISTMVLFTFNFMFTKKIMPELKIHLNNFSIKYVMEILRLGVWKLINSLGNILLVGLDLLIANITIGVKDMTTLSFTKTLPAFSLSLVTMISGTFVPSFLMNYLKRDKEYLGYMINVSIRVVGFFITIIMPLFMAFGREFFSLWLPGQDADLLQFISVIVLIGTAVSGIVSPLIETFTITKRMKEYSFILLASGIVNTFVVLLLVSLTGLGIYAIAGVSVVLEIIRSLVFVPIYAAKCLTISTRSIYLPILRIMLVLCINLVICILVNQAYAADSWLKLAVKAGLGCLPAILINSIFLINQNEKRHLIIGIRHRIHSF